MNSQIYEITTNIHTLRFKNYKTSNSTKKAYQKLILAGFFYEEALSVIAAGGIWCMVYS